MAAPGRSQARSVRNRLTWFPPVRACRRLRARDGRSTQSHHRLVHGQGPIRHLPQRDRGRPRPARFGPFLIVEVDNGASLDFTTPMATSLASITRSSSARTISTPSSPASEPTARLLRPIRAERGAVRQRNDGGRGVYFEDPVDTCSKSSHAPTAAVSAARPAARVRAWQSYLAWLYNAPCGRLRHRRGCIRVDCRTRRG